jgi:transcriptional regulator with XRE-family HTH domain
MKFDVDLVYKLIEEKGLSFSGFAKRIGMSHSGLKSAMEQQSMNLKNLMKICEYFDKPIGYFFKDNPVENVLNKIEADFYNSGFNSDVCFDGKVKLLEIIDGLINENKRLFDYIKSLEKEKLILIHELKKYNRSEIGDKKRDKTETN